GTGSDMLAMSPCPCRLKIFLIKFSDFESLKRHSRSPSYKLCRQPSAPFEISIAPWEIQPLSFCVLLWITSIHIIKTAFPQLSIRYSTHPAFPNRVFELRLSTQNVF